MSKRTRPNNFIYIDAPLNSIGSKYGRSKYCVDIQCAHIYPAHVQKRQNNLPRKRFASMLLLFFFAHWFSTFCHRTFVCVYIHNPPIIYIWQIYFLILLLLLLLHLYFDWMFLSHGLHQYDIMTCELNSTWISVICHGDSFSRSIHSMEMFLLHNVKTFCDEFCKFSYRTEYTLRPSYTAFIRKTTTESFYFWSLYKYLKFKSHAFWLNVI